MIRLFAAIAIPAEIGESLAPLQRGLAGARWAPLENLHITLRFAGEVAEPRADDLAAELSVIAAAPLAIRLSGVGMFGDGAGARAVWAGVEASEPLSRLRSRCETAARRAGLKADTRAWRPHLTLAYLRAADPARVAAWIQAHNLIKAPAFTARAFGLYSSWRAEKGSIYRLERSYALG